MKLPFYDKYTIDDANYECWRIIVADCPDSHRYATLCELVAECPEMKQLTRPCVVEFLNDMSNPKFNPQNLPLEKRFLKVWNNWCLELADPCVCNDWDRYVAATDDDNDPWPLDRKVKWSCSYDWLYCIDIEEAWPQTLVRRPSWPNWPFINPDLPDWECEWWAPYTVQLRKTWWEWKVDYACPEENLKPQYAKCVFSSESWMAATAACQTVTWTDWKPYRKWRTVRYFATRAWYPFPIDQWDDNAESYIEWDWEVIWTKECFWAPDSYWIIKIKKPWMYSVAFSCYVYSHQRNYAIRAWIWMNDWSWFREINDIKYQAWESYWDVWDQSVNRLYPNAWNIREFNKNWLDTNWEMITQPKWTIENRWLPFARTYNLNITTAPVELALVIKPDMRYIDPRIIRANDKDEHYKIKLAWWVWDAYWATSSIEIIRVWDAVINTRLEPI